MSRKWRSDSRNKVALVERLVDQCGFDAVLFEANQEEFIHLNQRLQSREAVMPDDLLTAVGDLWKFYREFQSLAPFLLTRARSGRVFLGGLDDRLASLGQNYANNEMIAGFTSLLPPPEQQRCNAAFRQRIYYDYPSDKPYSKLDQSQLETCLAKVDAAAHADSAVTGDHPAVLSLLELLYPERGQFPPAKGTAELAGRG